jgi:hypothetical protein
LKKKGVGRFRDMNKQGCVPSTTRLETAGNACIDPKSSGERVVYKATAVEEKDTFTSPQKTTGALPQSTLTLLYPAGTSQGQ